MTESRQQRLAESVNQYITGDENHAVAQRERDGLPFVAPGVPLEYGDPNALSIDPCLGSCLNETSHQ